MQHKVILLNCNNKHLKFSAEFALKFIPYVI